MLSKRMLLRPDRLRCIPSRFSWLDQRLVREGHLRGLGPWSGTLYLFLGTVLDRYGMSWYSARRICLETGMSFDELGCARSELVARDLIAFDDGLYQVLELPSPTPRQSRPPVRKGVVPGERPASREEVDALLAEFRQKSGR